MNYEDFTLNFMWNLREGLPLRLNKELHVELFEEIHEF